MPEIIEVKNYTDFIKSNINQKNLLDIKIKSGRYKTHGPFANYDKIKKMLPLKISDVNSKGKFMYIQFENNIFIKGEITQSSINTTISEINKSEKQINLIIDSNGGNLISGYNLIREMLKKTNINCYAINAQSTAFTIFQYCNNRYVMPDSTLFQHNISISFKGSFEEFDDFYKTRFDSYRLINHMVSKTISKKIKLKKEDYLKKQ